MCCLRLEVAVNDYVLHPVFGSCILKGAHNGIAEVETIENGFHVKVPVDSIMPVFKKWKY